LARKKFVFGPAFAGPNCEILFLFSKKHQILPVPCLFQVLFRNEAEGGRIHAIPKASGRRSVREDMSQVRIAMLAPDFSPLHEELMIVLLHDVPGFQGFGEAGPPSTGIVFILGTK
jgi:hypothetical protein